MSLRKLISVCIIVLALGCGDESDSSGSSDTNMGGTGGGEAGAGGEAGQGGEGGMGGTGGTGGGAVTGDCGALSESWDPDWLAFENEVLEITNERRAEGADCRSMGMFPPAPPLTGHELLRCAARQHSQDMAERGFFDHVSPEGETPADRVGRTAYPYRALGENIAAGAQSPRAVVDGWMNSDGHCSNIMNDQLEELGVGYYFKASTQMRHYWTQVFGTR